MSTYCVGKCYLFFHMAVQLDISLWQKILPLQPFWENSAHKSDSERTWRIFMSLRTRNLTFHVDCLSIMLYCYMTEVKGGPPVCTRNFEKRVYCREKNRAGDKFLYCRNLQGKGIWDLLSTHFPQNSEVFFNFSTPKTLFYLFSGKLFHHIHLCFYITLLIAVKITILKVLNLAIYFNSLRPTPSSSSLSPPALPFNFTSQIKMLDRFHNE